VSLPLTKNDQIKLAFAFFYTKVHQHAGISPVGRGRMSLGFTAEGDLPTGLIKMEREYNTSRLFGEYWPQRTAAF